MMFKLNSKSLKIIAVICVAVAMGIIGFLIVRASPAFISDTFTDETRIGRGTVRVEIATGQVRLAECYSPSPAWTKVADTTVRDISAIANTLATTPKDIYCDDLNCILWTDGAPAPGTVCIATDPNVYANVLWSRTDSPSPGVTRAWGSAAHNTNTTLISGGNIGGTHPSTLQAGNNNVLIDAKNWLENYYALAIGAFPAMDACRARGSGWRLPNILELDSIRDMTAGPPRSRLPGIASAWYWSSAEVGATSAYALRFLDGSVLSSGKYNTYRLRCVRAW